MSIMMMMMICSSKEGGQRVTGPLHVCLQLVGGLNVARGMFVCDFYMYS